ncbi:MAG TPA: PorP/SprF family type IX secretion system membrane protein [Phnomibacter sp.]|nr:PorP/SprF family type IX secretion system membrane protein [Phnomibacter sp.]
MKNLRQIGLMLIAVVPMITWGQDIHLSQFFEAPLWRNPSLAGLFQGDIRFQGVYRTQWGSVTVPYRTGSFNGEYKMPIGKANDFITLGGQLMYDVAGSTSFKTMHILPAVNYHKSLSEEKSTYLSLGFMAGLVQRSIDRTKITTNSQYDGTGYNPTLDINESLTNYNRSYADASVGLSFNSNIGNNEYDNYFVGVAYHHFNRPTNSFYHDPTIELNPKWVYSFGLHFGITPQTYLNVQADYSKQGEYSETLAGGMVGFALDGYDFKEAKYNLHLGAFMRWKDAIIPVVKLDFKPFSAAFSYDINTSPLRTASQGRGGFELSISYMNFFDRDNSTKNAVLCPRF